MSSLLGRSVVWQQRSLLLELAQRMTAVCFELAVLFSQKAS